MNLIFGNLFESSINETALANQVILDWQTFADSLFGYLKGKGLGTLL
jgi:hypothetical protein